MAESKVKCSGIKKAQNSQREGGDEEGDVPGAKAAKKAIYEGTSSHLILKMTCKTNRKLTAYLVMTSFQPEFQQHQ